LIFKKHKTDNKVLFIDGSKSVSNKAKNQIPLNRRNNPRKIVQVYKDRETTDKYSYLAHLKKRFAENELNLNNSALCGHLRKKKNENRPEWAVRPRTTRACKPNCSEL